MNSIARILNCGKSATNLNIFYQSTRNGSRYIKNFVVKKEHYDGDRHVSERFAKSSLESLAARGFCRPRKTYTPPEDVEKSVSDICKHHLTSYSGSWLTTSFSNPTEKFQILSSCVRTFDHDIPDAELSGLKCPQDVVNFFKTPVTGLNPYSLLVANQDKLPDNLYAIPEGVRFHPDTDTMFKGVTAYPGSGTVISGLRARKKYKGFRAERKWPFTVTTSQI